MIVSMLLWVKESAEATRVALLKLRIIRVLIKAIRLS